MSSICGFITIMHEIQSKWIGKKSGMREWKQTWSLFRRKQEKITCHMTGVCFHEARSPENKTPRRDSNEWRRRDKSMKNYNFLTDIKGDCRSRQSKRIVSKYNYVFCHAIGCICFETIALLRLNYSFCDAICVVYNAKIGRICGTKVILKRFFAFLIVVCA